MATEEKVQKDQDPEFEFDFLVDEDDEIEITIDVVATRDASGKKRPLPVDVDSCRTRLSMFEDTKATLESKLVELDPNDIDSQAERIKVESMLSTVNEQIKTLKDLIEAPKVKLTSYWKVQDWETTCKINSASVFTNMKGEYEYSDELNRKAKVKFLLKRWNLKDKKGNPIPVSEVSRVDGAVVEAFLFAYDRFMAMSKLEAKN
jgi:hypothetical protein